MVTIGVVAEKGSEFFNAGIEVNEQVAIIEGVKHYIPNPGSIIIIGGETDKCYQLSLEKLFNSFVSGTSKEEIFEIIVEDFLKINIKSDSLPKVGIVGDLFVRDNDTFNQNLIKHIGETSEYLFKYLTFCKYDDNIYYLYTEYRLFFLIYYFCFMISVKNGFVKK